MVLAIDIGNTNIVVGGFSENKIRFIERISTNKRSTALEYTVLLKTVIELNGLDVSKFEGGIVSSVVPSVTNFVREAAEKLIGDKVMVLGPGLKSGLKIQIDNPAQAGADLVAGAVAAVNNYSCPAIVIDLGTATTVSVINAEKTFIGGLIMPGLRASLEALTSSTSQLPNISLDAPKSVIGSNTVDCMRNGIIYSTAASLDGIIKRIENELGEKCTVISTGGLSSSIIPYCEREIIIDDELLLKGLMIIYNKNI
jgi:type III pantothenate kinase